MLLRELFNKDINEVSMSPGSLNKFLNSPVARGILAGFEFEAAMPVDRAGSLEQDYSLDISVDDDDSVIDFFSGGDNPLTRRQRRELRTQINDDFEEFIEKLAQEKFDTDGEEYIRELAKDDEMTNDEIETMISVKTRDYHEYESTVIDEYRDEVRNDIDWRHFWNYKNIDTMVDVATRYNLDWPYYTNESSDEDIIKNVADDIESALNIKITVSSKYHNRSGKASNWILEPDSSIQVPDEDSYMGLELITPTPPPPAIETLKYIDQVFNWAEKYGCETNSSTGFHISVSLPNSTTENIDWIKLVLFLGDEYVLQRFNRLGNTYTSSSFKLLDKHLDRPEFNFEKALAAIRSGLIDIATKEMGTPVRNKYISVNMKSNYIEFRSAGGDYLNNKEEIKNTFLRYIRAIAIAGDPNAERQEYLKKLYKFLKPDIGDNKASEIIRVFAMYNAGMLDLHQMKNRLKRKKAEKENLPPEKQLNNT
jgi:hypothetical protein